MNVLGAHILAKMCGAEDMGLIDMAGDYEAQYDAVDDTYRQTDTQTRNRLYRVLGAPENRIDLLGLLESSQYCHNINSPYIPPTLKSYVDRRNRRIKLFQFGEIARRALLAKTGLAPSSDDHRNVTLQVELLVKGPHRAFAHAMAARREEIRALNKAVERCCAEGLATTGSPWQLGHVYLLRDLAIQDLETTAEQLKELGNVIALLRHYRSAPRHAPQGR